MEENKVIKDLRVLSEEFIPSRIIHRDGQLKEIRDYLNPITNNQNPKNSFLYGSPGTGKTCISKYVVDELKKYSTVLNSYVNCWEYPSRFKILFNILQDLGETLSIHRKGTPTDELLDILKTKLEGKYCVIILDEVDQLESDKILYDLLQIPQIGLILISNSPHAFHDSDPRVRSRLTSLNTIPFNSYSPQEVFEILKDRSDWGLIPGSVKSSQLERIAMTSGGDARVAINILRSAAEEAENAFMDKIPDNHIEKAAPRVDKFGREKIIEKLNPYQKLILEIVAEKKKISSGELFKILKERIKKNKLNPIVDRTFRKYLEKMVKLNIISSSGEGRWRTYSLPV
jgi:orc1/cdc6 family replication initiation protein